MVFKPDSPALTSHEAYPLTDRADGKPRKIRRITRACDYCHRRSIKCKVRDTPNDKRCHNCYEFAQPCTYNRPTRRRGAKKRSPSPEAVNGNQERINDILHTPVRPSNPSDAPPQAIFTAYGQARVSKSRGPDWRAPDVANQAMIMDLVEIYFEIIYPL
jgi:hypothetical protein